MGFEDIIKRNEKALGRAHVAVTPTPAESAAVRHCPNCRADAKLLGVERVAAQSSAFRSSRYQCSTCMHAFDVPNPVTLGFLLLGGAGFLGVALAMFVNVKESDRVLLAGILVGFGAILLTWGIRAARTVTRSR